MENYDPQLARQIWERVQRREDTAGVSPALLPMIRDAEADAASCRNLQRSLPGWQGAVLGQLARKKRGFAACLKGILRLQESTVPTVAATAAAGPAETVLRHCLSHTLRSIRQCNDLSSHPEYGPVFAALARQETEQAQLLLQLIGSL